MKKIIVLMLSLFMLCACGSKNEEPVNEEKKTLVVGMECDYAPFNWTTNETNEYTVQITDVDYADGYDVVIAQRIADELGLELVIKKMIWDNLVPAVNSNDIDLIIAGMTDTPERRESVDFTTPYYESEMVCIIRADSELANINDIQDLKDYRIMGQLNTLYDEVIDQIEGIGDNHMTPQEAYPRMVLSLKQNECDALTAELPVALAIVQTNPDLAILHFEQGHGFDVDTSVSIAVKKDSSLLNDVQKALDNISQTERDEIMMGAMDRQPSDN